MLQNLSFEDREHECVAPEFLMATIGAIDRPSRSREGCIKDLMKRLLLCVEKNAAENDGRMDSDFIVRQSATIIAPVNVTC